MNILGSLVGPLLYGWLSDRIGRRPTFMTFLVLQSCTVSIYLLALDRASCDDRPELLSGAFQGALASGMLPTFAELFPTSIRANGQGFCLGGGRGFGSVVPATVGILAVNIPLGTSMGMCALASYGLAFCAALLLPETAGTDLNGLSVDRPLDGPAPLPDRPAISSTR